jgi:hypothetical protein
MLIDDCEGLVWDLVRVTEPSGSDSIPMKDQNQSPLYFDWWASVFNYPAVYFLLVVRRCPSCARCSGSFLSV